MSAQQIKDSWLPLNAGAYTLFKRGVSRKVYAALDQEYSEAHRDNTAELAALVEGVRDAHTPHTDSSELERTTAGGARDGSWGAALSVRTEHSRSSRAAGESEAVAAGDVSRYTSWLLSSPVTRGTAKASFGDVRPPDKASLKIDFSSNTHEAWVTESHHIAYE